MGEFAFTSKESKDSFLTDRSLFYFTGFEASEGFKILLCLFLLKKELTSPSQVKPRVVSTVPSCQSLAVNVQFGLLDDQVK